MRAYTESLTTIFMTSGLQKMAARVLACLYTTDSGSLTASELARRLEVSPASVSKAIAFLDGLELVRRERGEGRSERYVVDDDLFYQSIIRSAQDNERLVEAAREGVGVLGPGTPAAVRLENVARYMDFVTGHLVRAAEQARELLSTGPEAGSERE